MTAFVIIKQWQELRVFARQLPRLPTVPTRWMRDLWSRLRLRDGNRGQGDGVATGLSSIEAAATTTFVHDPSSVDPLISVACSICRRSPENAHILMPCYHVCCYLCIRFDGGDDSVPYCVMCQRACDGMTRLSLRGV
jgi:hypothetical protein